MIAGRALRPANKRVCRPVVCELGVNRRGGDISVAGLLRGIVAPSGTHIVEPDSISGNSVDLCAADRTLAGRRIHLVRELLKGRYRIRCIAGLAGVLNFSRGLASGLCGDWVAPIVIFFIYFRGTMGVIFAGVEVLIGIVAPTPRIILMVDFCDGALFLVTAYAARPGGFTLAIAGGCAGRCGASQRVRFYILFFGAKAALLPMLAAVIIGIPIMRTLRNRRFSGRISGCCCLISRATAGSNLRRHGGGHQTDHHDQHQQECRQLSLPKSFHRCSLHEFPELTCTNQWWTVT